MRPGLARAALIHVVLGNFAPGVVVVGIHRTQRRDPRPGRSQVGLDATVFAGAATGEVRHRVRAIAVNEQVGPVVLRSASRNDVLGDSRTADGLRTRAGVARGEFQDVRLVTGRERICVPHERIEFHRTDVVTSLCIVPPTVRADFGTGALCVASQRFKTRRRRVTADGVKNPLADQARARRHTEAEKKTVVVGFANRAITGNDPGAMRSVTVFVRSVGKLAKRAVMEQRGDPAVDVRMHVVGVATVEAAVSHGHGHARARVAEGLDQSLARGSIAADDSGRNLVK